MSKRDDFFRKGERGRRQRERSTNESLGKMECCKERKGGQNNNFKIMLLFNKLFIIFITIDFSHSYNILINPMACNSGPLNSPKPKRNNVSATMVWLCFSLLQKLSLVKALDLLSFFVWGFGT